MFTSTEIRWHYAETLAVLTLRVPRLERFRRSISDDPHAKVFVTVFVRKGRPPSHGRRTWNLKRTEARNRQRHLLYGDIPAHVNLKTVRGGYWPRKHKDAVTE